MASTIEQTLAVVLRCYVYKIPGAKSVAGHNASDWDLENPLNKTNNLRVKVVEIGEKCFVRIEESATNSLFLECAYFPQSSSITRVLDSSRYFVMRIEDPNRPNNHAWLGLGFQERDEAYEFENALRTHDKYSQRQAEIERQNAEWAAKHQDLSLKSGQTIHVAIKVDGSKGERKTRTPNSNLGILPPPSTNTGILLPPPSISGQTSSSGQFGSTGTAQGSSQDWFSAFTSPAGQNSSSTSQPQNDFFGVSTNQSSNSSSINNNTLADWGDFSSSNTSSSNKNPTNDSWATF